LLKKRGEATETPGKKKKRRLLPPQGKREGLFGKQGRPAYSRKWPVVTRKKRREKKKKKKTAPRIEKVRARDVGKPEEKEKGEKPGPPYRPRKKKGKAQRPGN